MAPSQSTGSQTSAGTRDPVSSGNATSETLDLPSSDPNDMLAALESVPRSVLEHVVDVHCHPTDSDMDMTLEVAENMAIRICAMATRQSDQRLVADLARAYPDKVIPCFGYHPWFSHWISLEPVPSKETHYRSLFLPPSDPPAKAELADAFDKLLPYLPDPIPLSAVLADLNTNLLSFPNAMLGEVGIDRACRVPYASPASPPYSPSSSCPADTSRERELSPFTIPLAHQLRVLEAQLALAVEHRRNVSLHSVKSQQATGALLDRMRARFGERWLALSVDLHSCGLSAQTWTDISKKHPNAFLSLSTAINGRSHTHLHALIAASAPDRLLVESDFHDLRRAAPCTWHMLRTVAAVRGWPVEDSWDSGHGEKGEHEEEGDREKGWGAVRRLEANWRAFERGGHRPWVRRRERRDRAIEEWEENEEGEEEGGS